MDKEKPLNPDYGKPVAYDSDGKPLYAHPYSENDQSVKQSPQAQAVHLVRLTDPKKQVISDEIRKKHEQSKRDYPECVLSDGEYIISVIRRHPIGLFIPIALGSLLIVLAFMLLFNFDLLLQSMGMPVNSVDASVIFLPVLIFSGFVMLIVYVAYDVYTNNKLFLTNESVVQEIQIGLFSKKERMVNLGDIEDVSYTQKGIIEQYFNIGWIRLSTEGEGTVYRFKYVANPKEVIAELKNAVSSFKSGRAIS